jgi:hypothetical protein
MVLGALGNLATIRSFELASVVLFAVALRWIWKQRNPLYLGAFLGAAGVFVHDWFWSTNGFFRVTFNHHLIGIPGIGIGGQIEPLSVPLNYAFGFGIPAVLYASNKKWMDQTFGRWQYPLLWLAGAVGVGIYEIPVVHLLGIWEYHQRPGFEFLGFPWSNFWLAANLIGGSCVAVAFMARWANLPDRAGFALRDETTWKGLVMGSFPVMTVFYLTGMLQLWWYSAVTPWVNPSPRPF